MSTNRRELAPRPEGDTSTAFSQLSRGTNTASPKSNEPKSNRTTSAPSVASQPRKQRPRILTACGLCRSRKRKCETSINDPTVCTSCVKSSRTLDCDLVLNNLDAASLVNDLAQAQPSDDTSMLASSGWLPNNMGEAYISDPAYTDFNDDDSQALSWHSQMSAQTNAWSAFTSAEQLVDPSTARAQQPFWNAQVFPDDDTQLTAPVWDGQLQEAGLTGNHGFGNDTGPMQ